MKKLLPFIALAILFLTGCATTVYTKVQRPAELDLNGAKSIAVLPFHDDNIKEFSISLFSISIASNSQNSEQKEISSYATQNLTKIIAENGYYDLISSSVVENAIKNGTDIPCDIYITGHIDSFFSDIKQVAHTDTDSLGNTKTSYTFKKNVSYNITFEIIEAKTKKVIAYVSNRLCNNSLDYDSKSKLPRALDLTRLNLDHELSQINRKIQPYTESVSYTLLETKDKNETMKQASSIAKTGNLDAARTIFEQLYNDMGIMEAGYNAAILYEAMGNYAEAEKLMTKVAKTSENAKAYTALSVIQSEIKKKERLEQQMAK